MSSTTFTRKQRAERLAIALDASYEMEMVSRHLNKELPMEQPEYQHLRALVIRVLHLNSVVMSVLSGDDGRDTAEMRRVMEGL